MSGTRKIERDHYLFREGDAPDAMYVVKSGKFNVVKTKQNSEVVLAEIGPGAMVGEMAFFDDKPRSASVRATKDSEVITLPYKALRAQFSTMPEWSKAIMRTVNDHLRTANKRIKEIERTTADEAEVFPPHQTNKLISILSLVGNKYGKAAEDGLILPGGVLRNYTIQIFQEPTHKMQKLMSALSDLKMMKIEDMGEGRQRICIFKPEILFGFVEWYNEWLFKQEKDRILIKEEELKLLNAVLHFARKTTKNEKGILKLNLTEMQNESMRELGYFVKLEELLPLVEKKLMGEQLMENSGIFSQVPIEEIEKVVPFWSIVYALRKVRK
jgi:CRP/FNR family cyclic AMP-dependent transcriptional regulator